MISAHKLTRQSLKISYFWFKCYIGTLACKFTINCLQCLSVTGHPVVPDWFIFNGLFHSILNQPLWYFNSHSSQREKILFHAKRHLCSSFVLLSKSKNKTIPDRYFSQHWNNIIYYWMRIIIHENFYQNRKSVFCCKESEKSCVSNRFFQNIILNFQK